MLTVFQANQRDRVTGLSMGNLFQISLDFNGAAMTSPQCAENPSLRVLVHDRADWISCVGAASAVPSSSPPLPPGATFMGPKVTSPGPKPASHTPVVPPSPCRSLQAPIPPAKAYRSQGPAGWRLPAPDHGAPWVCELNAKPSRKGN